jgi:hypothetical protein
VTRLSSTPHYNVASDSGALISDGGVINSKTRGPASWLKKKEEKRRGENSRSAGLDLAPVGAVDLVHLGKVGHVGQEDVDLDDLVERGAGGFENGRQVLDALMLWNVSVGVALDSIQGLNVRCEPGCHRESAPW